MIIKLFEKFNNDILDRIDDCLAYFDINKSPIKSYYSKDLSISSDRRLSDVNIVGYFFISNGSNTFTEDRYTLFKNRVSGNNLKCLFFRDGDRLEFTFYDIKEFDKADVDQFKMNMKREGHNIIII